MNHTTLVGLALSTSWRWARRWLRSLSTLLLLSACLLACTADRDVAHRDNSTVVVANARRNRTEMPNMSSTVCKFPSEWSREELRCVSAADLLGIGFLAFNIGYQVLLSLTLFGFIRSGLYMFQAAKYHLSSQPSILIPFIGALAQILELISTSNLYNLRWEERLWSTLGSDLFTNCIWSMWMVWHAHKRKFFEKKNAFAPHKEVGHDNIACVSMGHGLHILLAEHHQSP